MFHNAEYIYAVYKTGSFSAAAKELYITQPCLSAMVKKKEAQLGVPLFDRNSKPLRLTEFGVQYINYLEKIWNLEHEYEKCLSDVRGLRTGRLSIGASNDLASFVLPPIIQNFKAKYSGVQVQIFEGNIDYLQDALTRGKLDLILENSNMDTEIFTQHQLCTEQLLLAAHKSIHDATPLSDQYLTYDDIMSGRHMKIEPFSLFPDALAHTPIITMRTENDARSRMDSIFDQAGLSADIQLEVDQLATAYNIACTGVGLTLVSDTLLYRTPPHSNMYYYKLPHLISTRYVYMYHKRSRYIHLAMQKFMDITFSTLADGILYF